MKHINLFLIINETMRVFDENLKPLLKDGEMEFKINEHFWQWWKESVGYVKGDECDLCFVWDKENEIVFHHDLFQSKIDGSAWGKGDIVKILENLGFDKKFDLLNANQTLSNSSKVVFFTNVNIKSCIKPYKQNSLQSEATYQKTSKAYEALKRLRAKGKPLY